jgi:hypothetical protein
MPSSCLATFVLAAAASAASGVQQGSHDRVPRAVERAARHGTIEQFANAVAAARIPTGFVIAAEDNRRPKTWRPDSAENEGPPADLEDAVSQFERRNPHYVVRHRDGVLRIRPAAETPCVRAVEQTFDGMTASGMAFEVVYEAVRARNRDQSPAPPPGLVGSIASSPDPYRTFVSVDLQQASLADILDAVVRDAPGLGWAVRELRVPKRQRRDDDPQEGLETRCNVVLFAGDSWTDSPDYIDLRVDRKDK